MAKELWIWTELLAFDRDLPEHGAGEYLNNFEEMPAGIHLLLSSIDFVLLHRGMSQEYELFPDVCSRVGHACNEDRKRQKWSNYDLRDLICAFQKRGIKVFFSFFIANLHDRFHHEFATDHPEIRLGCRKWGIDNALSMLARLNDGRLLDDLLAEKITEVVADYGFDGWCGPDGQGPGWSLIHSDSSDNFVCQFDEYLGGGKIPAEYLAPAGSDDEKMNRRVDYLWRNFRDQWADFTSKRWVEMWKKITDALHEMKRETMIYSPFAQSVFESIFFFGLDYRKLREIGIDYLVTESVTTSCSLLYGGEERLFDNCAIINELRAVLPECKLIVMVGIKDVVESFDPLRHAPMRLERDIFLPANQSIISGGKAQRSADGFMVCLGDGLSRAEWSAVEDLHRKCFSFEPEECGELVWLLDDRLFDAMRLEYPLHGNWPPYQFAGELVRRCALDVSCVCPSSELAAMHRPLVVPHFELLSPDLQQEILAREECTVLIGNGDRFTVPAGMPSVSCRMDAGYQLVCVVLNGAKSATGCTVLPDLPDTGEFNFSDWDNYISDRCPRMPIPDAFWESAGKLIRAALPCRSAAPSHPAVRTMTMRNAAGTLQIALMSTLDIYLSTRCRFADEITAIRKCTSFPYMPLELRDHELSSPDFRPAVHVPPQGMILLNAETGQTK